MSVIMTPVQARRAEILDFFVSHGVIETPDLLAQVKAASDLADAAIDHREKQAGIGQALGSLAQYGGALSMALPFAAGGVAGLTAGHLHNTLDDVTPEEAQNAELIREYESNADHLSTLKARLRAARAQQLPARARVTPSTNGY